MIDEAILFAGEAHHSDTWSGLPYMVHLALTAEGVRRIVPSEHAIATAWLHDVLEDHPIYQARLEDEFSDLLPTIMILTRRPDEEYDDFIDRIVGSGDRMAIAVKLSDMRVNLAGDPPDRLWQRYSRNIGKLESAFRR